MYIYNITQSGNALKIELIPDAGDTNPKLQYADSIDWNGEDRFKFLKGGQYVTTLLFGSFTVADSTPTDAEDAANLIDAIIANFNGGGSAPTYIADGDNTTVSGSGTEGDPYQINATGGGDSATGVPLTTYVRYDGLTNEFDVGANSAVISVENYTQGQPIPNTNNTESILGWSQSEIGAPLVVDVSTMTTDDLLEVALVIYQVVPPPAFDINDYVGTEPDNQIEVNGVGRLYVPPPSPPTNPRVYRALLTQTGTDAPTAIVLENTLGFVPTYSRDTPGIYLVESTNGFTVDKTYPDLKNTGATYGITNAINTFDATESSIPILSGIPSIGGGGITAMDDLLYKTPFEILIYDYYEQ